MTTDVGPFDFIASYGFSFLVQFHQNLFILRYKEEIISLTLNTFIYNRGTPETQYTYIDAFEKGQFLSQSELSERVGLPEEMANLPELCRAVSPVQVYIILVV